MTIIFDGKKLAEEKEQELNKEVVRLKKKGITPKLVSILVGDDPGNKLYLKLKKKAAERVGAELEIVELKKPKLIELTKLIKKLNTDKGVHGIMIQLPLPDIFSKQDRYKIIQTIALEKDVDGLSDGGPYLAPVVMAVVEAIKVANNSNDVRSFGKLRTGSFGKLKTKIMVVGAKGFVGKKIVEALLGKTFEKAGPLLQGSDFSTEYEIVKCDADTVDLKEKTKSADILISATGVRGLVKEDMVKDGAILIDVGAPKGDIDKKAYQKASFVSPIPGGIGPVTIVCLLENLINTASKLNEQC